MYKEQTGFLRIRPILLRGLLALIMVSLPLTLWSADLPLAKPESVGLSKERLARIVPAMDKYIKNNLVPGTGVDKDINKVKTGLVTNHPGPVPWSPGSYYWGGAYCTLFWVDPKEQLIGMVFTQLIPYAHINLRHDFIGLATQAIVD
ncbi:MAG: hypothetical protein HY787_14110 [Deltaproteobacteria bacterium]|nr:hypothetical protein [Deltaproteobacteria bacterium]